MDFLRPYTRQRPVKAWGASRWGPEKGNVSCCAQLLLLLRSTPTTPNPICNHWQRSSNGRGSDYQCCQTTQLAENCRTAEWLQRWWTFHNTSSHFPSSLEPNAPFSIPKFHILKQIQHLFSISPLHISSNPNNWITCFLESFRVES